MSNPRWPRADATDHLRALAKQHDLRINWAQDWQQSGTVHCNGVVVPKPYNAKLYMVALHEFGHLIDPLARRLWNATEKLHSRTRSRDYLACEAAATGWAIDNADPQLLELFPYEVLDYLLRGFGAHADEVCKSRREALLR